MTSVLAIAAGLAQIKWWTAWALLALAAIAAVLTWTIYVVRRFPAPVRWVALFSVLIVGSGATVVTGTFQKALEQRNCELAREHSQKADDYTDDDQANRAIAEHTAAIELCANADDHLGRGYAEAANGRERRAIEDLDRSLLLAALSQTRIRRGAFLKRGILHNNLGDCDEAAVSFRKALAVDKGFDPAYHNFAITRAMQGIYTRNTGDGALELIDKALQLNTRQPHYLFVRGKVYVALGERKKAEADLRNAIAFSGPKDSGTKKGASDLVRTAWRNGGGQPLFGSCAVRK